MPQKLFSKILKYGPQIIALIFLTGFAVFAAWQEPSQQPPEGNVPPPVTVSGNQTITGLKTFNPSSGNVPFAIDPSKTGIVENLNAKKLGGWTITDIFSVERPLSGASCSGGPAPAGINQRVSWSFASSGGLSPYAITWIGTDSLSGSEVKNTPSTFVIVKYSSLGSKTISSFTITDAIGQTVSGSCPNIEVMDIKYVFTTSNRYNGNLGGLSGADAKCQTEADNRSKAGTFKAWLSDSKTSAKDRLTHPSIPYYTIGYTSSPGWKVVDNWTDLTDGNLDFPIPQQTTGAHAPDRDVWTSTDESGLKRGDDPDRYFCGDWTKLTGSAVGIGNSWASDREWSVIEAEAIPCPDPGWPLGSCGYYDYEVTCQSETELRLYCFEQ